MSYFTTVPANGQPKARIELNNYRVELDEDNVIHLFADKRDSREFTIIPIELSVEDGSMVPVDNVSETLQLIQEHTEYATVNRHSVAASRAPSGLFSSLSLRM